MREVFGTFELVRQKRGAFGCGLLGLSEQHERAAPYLDDIFNSERAREDFFRLVDNEGVVVCKNLLIDESPYRKVGGKRSAGRLSQGEYFHHDGCSKPENPRVVEIRCPAQHTLRTMNTAGAPFPKVVSAMVEMLPASIKTDPFFEEENARLLAMPFEHKAWENLQGKINRTLRLLSSEITRDYFRSVDKKVGAYVEPWTFNESRFYANQNDARTVQHRRACPLLQTPSGGLLKRWPAEELDDPSAP